LRFPLWRGGRGSKKNLLSVGLFLLPRSWGLGCIFYSLAAMRLGRGFFLPRRYAAWEGLFYSPAAMRHGMGFFTPPPFGHPLSEGEAYRGERM